MALTPASQDAFLKEVDDAVRQDQMLGLWNRYGRMAIAALGLFLIAFGGWLYYRHWSELKSGEVAEQADRLIASVQGGATDQQALAAVADGGQPGYRAIAALAKAADAARRGDLAGSARLYGEIAASDDYAQPWRDLALIRKTALSFDTTPPQQVIDTLKPLAVDGEPWFASAGEMTAIAYMKLGKDNLAGPIFAAIAKDSKAPGTVRSRAAQMAGLLGIDVVGVSTQNREVVGQ